MCNKKQKYNKRGSEVRVCRFVALAEEVSGGFDERCPCEVTESVPASQERRVGGLGVIKSKQMEDRIKIVQADHKINSVIRQPQAAASGSSKLRSEQSNKQTKPPADNRT